MVGVSWGRPMGWDLGTPQRCGAVRPWGEWPLLPGESRNPLGRDRGVTHEDTGDAVTKQPFNAGLGARGAGVPGAVGIALRLCPPRVSPALSSTTNSTDTQRGAGGRQVRHLLLGTVTLTGSCQAQPQSACSEAEKNSSGSSPRSPSRSSMSHPSAPTGSSQLGPEPGGRREKPPGCCSALCPPVLDCPQSSGMGTPRGECVGGSGISSAWAGTCRGEQPSGSGGKIRRRLLGVTLR